MELILKVLAGKNAGQEIKVPVPKFLIGRGEDCHLRPRSDMVSRHHCLLAVADGGATVRDLDSRNGTFVNDERIAGERPLKTGDRLTIGQLKFEVHLQAEVPAAPRPKALDVKTTAKRTAAAAKGSDEDVTAWLSEGGEAAAQDTARIDLSDTNQFDPADDSPTVSEAKTVDESSAKPAGEDEIEAGPKGPLKAPTPPKPKDSRDAATQILKQFLKSR